MSVDEWLDNKSKDIESEWKLAENHGELSLPSARLKAFADVVDLQIIESNEAAFAHRQLVYAYGASHVGTHASATDMSGQTLTVRWEAVPNDEKLVLADETA